MKDLQLTPPLLIIVMGGPGSGKTFFGRQFSEQFNLPRISEDVIRFELFEQPQFNADELEITGRVTHYALAQIMKTQQTVVCEGMYLQLEQRKQLYELASICGYHTLTIWLQTDTATAVNRVVRRDRRSTNIMKTLDRPVAKEPILVISGKHTYRSQSIAVLKKITLMYSENLQNARRPLNPLAAPRKPMSGQKPLQRYIQ
jgi:predicted kinase